MYEYTFYGIYISVQSSQYVAQNVLLRWFTFISSKFGFEYKNGNCHKICIYIKSEKFSELWTRILNHDIYLLLFGKIQLIVFSKESFLLILASIFQFEILSISVSKFPSFHFLNLGENPTWHICDPPKNKQNEDKCIKFSTDQKSKQSIKVKNKNEKGTPQSFGVSFCVDYQLEEGFRWRGVAGKIIKTEMWDTIWKKRKKCRI